MKSQASRLADLLEEMPSRYGRTSVDKAKYLINNGVILPPCKIGDKVYFPKTGEVGTVTSFFCCDNPDAGDLWISINCNGYKNNKKRVNISANEFGKTVFLENKE